MIFLGNARTQKLYQDIIAENITKYVLVSCQYPKKIDVSLHDCPCVNIHYGVLPYFRGMAPIYHQMMSGDTAGVTLHYMDNEFDTGDIIDSYSFPHHGKTANEVYDECEKRGKELLIAHLPKIIDGTARRTKQTGGTFWKSPRWHEVKKIHTPFFDSHELRTIFATHFEGKQYPIMEICGRKFELRAV
jgi:methionyl-tRNA formyltransferase